ncbi:MAG TPA: SHOCT domain-containing protein [Conexibacter sp.]|nr:SHOCT domain-containing protein [Conexibacter sp.]
MLVLGTVVAVLSIVAVWANRQLLNADNWANTSTALLENGAIRTAVSGYLVDQVYANVDVSSEIASALPTRLEPLAGPAASGLRNVAQDVTDKALERPVVQQAWKTANRIAAERFIAIAENKSTLVRISGNTVYLDLGALVVEMGQRLGLPGTLTSRIPPDAGRVPIVNSRQASAVQGVTAALRGLAVVLPLLGLALFAAAVWLAHGRRRVTLRTVGWCLVVAGVVTLVARSVVGQRVVDSLAKTDAVKPAAQATWSIATSMLHDIAWATIWAGVPVIAAAWLAGATRPAVALRRAAAPWLIERPEVAYGVAGALVLLVIAWGPLPATRQLLPVLLMIALVALGVAALRRQVAVEFPGATVRDARTTWQERVAHARTAAHERLTRAREHAPGLHAGSRAGGDGAAAHGDGGPPALVSPAERVALLERLAALHAQGVLSDDELAAEKAALPPARNGA